MPTEELQGEIGALDDTTVKQSCVIKSEMFGEISTDLSSLKSNNKYLVFNICYHPLNNGFSQI